MEGGEEDPFGYLIKFCRPTASQELKLQNCPFARESETFPDAFDSLGSSFSPTQTPSQQPGIVMVSLSDSEDEDLPIDENTSKENEEFLTPPEHHRLSSSSQEGPPRNLKPISAVDEKIEGPDDAETVAVDDACRNDELGGEHIGFSVSEEMDGGDVGVLGAASLDTDDQVESELKKARVFEGELDELALKRIRVSEENWDSKMHNLGMGGTPITKKGDDDDGDEVINLDIDGTDEELGSDEDTILIDVDSSEEESDDGKEVNENGEMLENDGGFSEGRSKRDCEVGKVKCGDSHGDDGNKREDEGVHLDNGEKSMLNNVAQNNGEVVLGVVGLDGGERRVLRNGDLVVEESEEGATNNRCGKLRENGKEVLGFMNREDIDKFKYNGGVDGGDQCWKRVVRRRRELPLSMREKGYDKQGKERVVDLDVKNLPWKELLDVVKVTLKEVDNGSEDVDFLEKAKSRGMTFPQPRWI